MPEQPEQQEERKISCAGERPYDTPAWKVGMREVVYPHPR